MSTEQKTTVEAELQMMEKLHKLGDQTGARMIAKRLLISQTLNDDDRGRIDRVINADKIKTVNMVVIAIAIFVIICLYFWYEN